MHELKKKTHTCARIKTREFLQDLQADMSDEKLLQKYQITWQQLTTIYSKLLHRGALSQDDLRRRLVLRVGKNTSHIPIVEINEEFPDYTCSFCGFSSMFHFSTCPECRTVNLRRLTKRSIVQLFRRRIAATGLAS